jgi:hypothetical protein
MRLPSTILILTVSAVSAFSQTGRTPSQPAPRPQTTTLRLNVKPWEYLIISFGKTFFSDPTDEPEIKTAGMSKLLNYSRAGIVSANEAVLIERQMDTLGKFGWELIGIVGVIGGDQEMVFRRPYDPDQSKTEAALIKEEGETLLSIQRNKVAATAQADFVDLDEVEREQLLAEARQKEETRLKSVITGLADPRIVDVKVTSTAYAPTDSRVSAEIIVDGSELLSEGNKYRSSGAEALAKLIGNSIYRSAGLINKYSSISPSVGYSLAEVKISVSIRLSYQGKQKIVATENVGGNWPERR